MTYRPVRIALILACVTPLLMSCGDKKEYTGQFVDSPVAGLRYKTDSQDGLTNENGEFQYRRQETVEFFLGNFSLGSSHVRSTVTPLDLADTDSYDNNRVINIARLLQSLDSNSGQYGIQISDAARNESGRLDGVNLDADPSVFANDGRVVDYLTAVTSRTELIDQTTAINNLKSGINATDDSANDFNVTIADINSPVYTGNRIKQIYLSGSVESGIEISTVEWKISKVQPDDAGLDAVIDPSDSLDESLLTIQPYIPVDGQEKVLTIRLNITAKDGKKGWTTKQLTICGVPNCS
ncbi:MAG TPA: hypothetical protein VFM46_02610 [Pseudomonadales bacterium]|nr:hypothetical protein [Pseudomonadales bacterium]